MDMEPLVSVVRGRPTPEELAALVTILAAGSTPGVAGPVAVTSAWAASSKPYAGPRSWKESARPR